ncbi:cytochrome p450 domain-containing protein [Phthorimaea operculella]|nr:cytochrome p450 domain-containing protein [Phthorimaea operculella]
MPPKLPNALPIIGVTHMVIGKDTKGVFKVLKELGKQIVSVGGVSHSYFPGASYFYGITDPDDSLTILNQCLEKNWVYEVAKPWTGDGLATVTSNLGLWKRHRKTISRAFNLHVLNDYMDVFNQRSRTLVQKMRGHVDRGPFEHFEIIADMSIGVIYQTLFGCSEEEIQALLDHNIIIAIEDLLKIIAARMISGWMLVPFLFNFTKLKKKQDNILAYLHEQSNTIINIRRKHLLNSDRRDTKLKSFLDLLLDLPPEEELSLQEIREEVDTMIMAGTDTTSTTLAFTLMTLGSYPDVQKKVCEELRQVFGDSLRDVQKDDLKKLVYLEAVLMETMRLYPILPVIPRYVSEEIKLKNYTIPPGNTCLIFAYHVHRDPSLWGADAGEFKPQRWLPTPPAARAFFGFSQGKRGCIGKAFGMMSMKTTLAHVLRHYRISADVTKLQLQLDLLLKPASGCEITVDERH